MLYPKPARTRLTTHGQMICRAHIPQLHTERGRSDGHKETERRAHNGGDGKIDSKQEDEKLRGGGLGGRKESKENLRG